MATIYIQKMEKNILRTYGRIERSGDEITEGSNIYMKKFLIMIVCRSI